MVDRSTIPKRFPSAAAALAVLVLSTLLPAPASAQSDGVEVRSFDITDGANRRVVGPLEAGSRYEVAVTYDFTATFSDRVVFTTACDPIGVDYWQVLSPEFGGFDRSEFRPYARELSMGFRAGRLSLVLSCTVPEGATLSTDPAGGLLHHTLQNWGLLTVRLESTGQQLRSSHLVTVKDATILRYDAEILRAEERLASLERAAFTRGSLLEKGRAILGGAKAQAEAGRIEGATATALAVPGREDLVDPAPAIVAAIVAGVLAALATLAFVSSRIRGQSARHVHEVVRTRAAAISRAIAAEDFVALSVPARAVVRSLEGRRPPPADPHRKPNPPIPEA